MVDYLLTSLDPDNLTLTIERLGASRGYAHRFKSL